MEMLNTWCQKMGKDGTVGILKEVLEEIGLKNVADNLDMHMYKDVRSFLPRNRTACEKQHGEIHTLTKSYSMYSTSATGQSPNWQDGVKQAADILAGLLGGNFAGAIHAPDVNQTTRSCDLRQNQDMPMLAAASICVRDPLDETTAKDPWDGSSIGYLEESMLRFHPTVHGTQVYIEGNGTVARSRDSLNNGVCFTKLPVKIGEEIHLKVIDSKTFHESLRFGFTSKDPDSMTVEELPPHSYPALAQEVGFWVKSFPASLAHQGCVVTFTLEQSGDVNFAVDGSEVKELFFSGVDVSQPLWAVVDVHGSAVAVQFVGEQATCEAFEKWIHEGDQVQLREMERDELKDMQKQRGHEFDPDMEKVLPLVFNE
ncbi:NEURL1 [Branchiostoma lanceolatum]|uniref:NEURL1 protein n=1 Tax=Branchiostoma lanceolatum TaxID=7740 RepID=A0A8S4MPJ3_BRALA|nr:NEURL1 [Branchiostoma lanceolatum]